MQRITIHKGELGIPIGFSQSADDISGATSTIYYQKPNSDTTGTWAGSMLSTTSLYYNLTLGDIDTAGSWLVWGKVIEATKTRWCGPVELYVIDTP
ncbi:MAG: hypothetical protein GY853_15340 [PVC group bacterium]|nr:hypothetical protein [PVC group bacterium]